MPKALYAGKLFDGLVDCYVLDDKRRVISQRGMVRTLTGGGAKDGKITRFVERLPEKFRHLASGPAIEFILPSGGRALGRESEWAVDVWQAYVDAHFAGELHPAQEELARHSANILRSLGKVGLAALIDEATGYQEVRASDELRGLFARYLRDEPMAWTRMWDDEVVGKLCSLYQVERSGKVFPAFLGTVIGKLYQTILPADVYAELKQRNGSGNERQGKHHQFFRDSLWRFVNNDIPTIAYFARVSRSRDEFWNHVHARYQDALFQLSMRGVE